MLQFANPALLFFLALVPLLIAYWLGRKRAALRFGDTSLFAGLPASGAKRVRLLTVAFRALAVTSLVIAVAGPRLPDLKTRIPTESIAIMIVLDTSGSMVEPGTFLWQEGSPKISRHEASKRAFRLFVAGGEAPDGTRFEGRSTERGTDAIGLVTFEMWPHPVCPPTLNHSVLLHIMEGTKPGTAEGSNIGDAMVEGLIRLEKATPRRKVLILISDGELEYPDKEAIERKPLKPRQAAQLAANLGIPIYVVDAGGELPGNKDDQQRRLDGREINAAIAHITNGRLFDANNGKEMLSVCKTIDGLERQPILSNSYRRYVELYPWFAGAALTCIVGVVVWELTRWRRIP